MKWEEAASHENRYNDYFKANIDNWKKKALGKLGGKLARPSSAKDPEQARRDELQPKIINELKRIRDVLLGFSLAYVESFQ